MDELLEEVQIRSGCFQAHAGIEVFGVQFGWYGNVTAQVVQNWDLNGTIQNSWSG
jgi:hypothetical protein